MTGYFFYTMTPRFEHFLLNTLGLGRDQLFALASEELRAQLIEVVGHEFQIKVRNLMIPLQALDIGSLQGQFDRELESIREAKPDIRPDAGRREAVYYALVSNPVFSSVADNLENLITSMGRYPDGIEPDHVAEFPVSADLISLMIGEGLIVLSNHWAVLGEDAEWLL